MEKQLAIYVEYSWRTRSVGKLLSSQSVSIDVESKASQLLATMQAKKYHGEILDFEFKVWELDNPMTPIGQLLPYMDAENYKKLVQYYQKPVEPKEEVKEKSNTGDDAEKLLESFIEDLIEPYLELNYPRVYRGAIQNDYDKGVDSVIQLFRSVKNYNLRDFIEKYNKRG